MSWQRPPPGRRQLAGARFTGPSAQTGRYRYASRWVHGTKRDDQRAAAALATEADRGAFRQTTRHSGADLLDRWMEHIEGQGRAPSTLVRYRSAIDAKIKPHLGNLSVTKVGPAELDGLYSRLARGGLSPLSVRKSHAVLSAAFNQAVLWGWADVNRSCGRPAEHPREEIRAPEP